MDLKNSSTERLYDDGHIKNFTAVVVSCDKVDGAYEAVLDRTAFFPEGGGQLADTGRLGEAVVSDVKIVDGVIYHTIDIPLKKGMTVVGEIDWEQRFRRMQNHTGEHIVSGITHSLYGYSNVGFHMGSEDITLDFDSELTRQQIREIEVLANKAVAANVQVSISYPTAQELESLDYRSKLELDGGVRIVTIEGYDCCACCAPHVKRTGEVGMIKLLDFLRYKGGVRIHMKCGLDALDDYNTKYDNVSKISALLSAKQEETSDAVERVLDELSAKKFEIAKAKKRIAFLLASALQPTQGNICLFEEELSADEMREIVNGGVQKCTGVCAVFSGNDTDGYNYVIGSSSVDLKMRSKEINLAINGRGGGRSEMIQGSSKAARAVTEEYFAKCF